MSGGAIFANFIGSLIKHHAQQKAGRAGEDQADALKGRLNYYRGQGDDIIRQNMGMYNPEARGARFNATRTDAGNNMVDTMNQIMSGYQSAPADTQSYGEAFDMTKAKRVRDSMVQLDNLARLMGYTRAPSQMMGNEAVANADFGSKLSHNLQLRQNLIPEGQAMIEKALQPHPGQMAIGEFLGGVGSKYKGGNYGS